jgi:hypothetical protein
MLPVFDSQLSSPQQALHPDRGHGLLLLLFSGLVGLMVGVSGCSGDPAQQALAPDPNAQETGRAPVATLPPNFPTDLGYPNARLVASGSLPSSEGSGWLQTRWRSPDPNQSVLTFYQGILQQKDWKLQPPQETDTITTLRASKENRQVVVNIHGVTENGALLTEFAVLYGAGVTGTPPQTGLEPTTGTTVASPNPTAQLGQPGASPSLAASPATVGGLPADLGTTPQPLQAYVQDLYRLGVLTDTGNTTGFNPNQPVTRRVFARWLMAANNRIFADRAARQIRPANSGDTPAFRDVPAKDPDFAVIQGLAAAGYIPSPLSGNSTQALFRPDAPLSREVLLQWKVPVDVRQNLPTATLEGVRQVWGFKDINRITPEALPAVLADYQNGDQANIRRLFGSTLLLQPQKPVSRAEAAAALWYIGYQNDGLSAQDGLKAITASPTPAATPSASPTGSPTPAPGR